MEALAATCSLVYGFICRFHVGKENQMEITHSSIWQIERLLEEQFSTYRVNVDFVMNPGEDYIKIMAKIDDDEASVILNPEEVTPAFVADVLAEKIKEQRAAKWPPTQPPKPGTGGIGIEAPRMTVGTRNGVYDYQQVWIPEGCIDMIANAVVKKLEERLENGHNYILDPNLTQRKLF